ncbi:hypothetical protein EPO44_07295 [bacterium]|nr:MAG: hypothetical protein EPO44_07295 [bacterium]
MIHDISFVARAAEQKPAVGKTLQEVPTNAPWWSGVVVDSISGFSATLVFVLAGVLYLRKRMSQRGHSKYNMEQPRKQTS